MWILPKQLHTSAFVPDTAALRLDCTELSEICARSLFVRSKPSPARTWSAKWRRDSWTQHLSGRILKPSHGQSFVTAWTSSLAVIPASPSAQPENASAQKTLGTSGLSSQTEFDFFAPDSAISRMSKDTSASDSERSLESWNKLVIQRRGEYSARLKSAHRISASGSSSWPTIRASEYKDTGPIGSKSHDHMLGKGYLWKRIAFRASIGRKSIPDGNLGEQMQRLHGQAAPANPSTDGSRQESWPTPRAACPGSRPNGNGGKILEEEVRKSWATPQAHDAQGPKTPEQIEAMRAKGHGVKNLNEQATWATPQLQDGHNINQDSTTHKTIPAQLTKMNMTGKLNPRWVETLMGLPVGWVMPSCASPVTIEQTNFDSSATESCLPQPRELFEF